jgi:hypothetical protein
MASGTITLNSVGYKCVPFDMDGQTALVHRYSVNQEAPAYSTVGQQEAQRVTSYTSVRYPPPIYGFGRNRIAASRTGGIDERDFMRLWHAEHVMTHYSSQTTLGISAQASTSTGVEVMRASAQIGDTIVGLWEDDTGADMVARLYNTSDEWTGGGSIHSGSAGSNEAIILDMIAHEDTFIALFSFDNGSNTSHSVYYSTDGASWSSGSGVTASLIGAADQYGAHVNFDGGLLAVIGNEVVAVVWHKANGSITFFSTGDKGANWSDEAVDIPSSNGPQGVAVMRSTDGADKLFVATAEGLWEVDTAPSTWTVHQFHVMMPRSINHGRRMATHKGSLWVPFGVGDNEPADMLRLTVSGSEYLIEQTEMINGNFIGLNAGDGVPVDMFGPWRWLLSAGNLLFGSVGGGISGRTSRILVHNGLGWHPFHLHSAANQEIEWMGIHTDSAGDNKLLFAIRTATDASTMKFLEDPLINPISEFGGIVFEAAGVLDRPEYDGDMPREKKNFFRVFVDAIALGDTSAEYENIDYRKDGSTSNTDIGNIVDGTLELTLATPTGVEARSLAIRQNLFRGSTTTLTPKDRGVTAHYKVRLPVLQGFAFMVDIDATAEDSGKTNAEVRTDLETARDSVVFVPLQYGDIATPYYVDVKPDIRWPETFEGGVVGDPSDSRHGFAFVRAEEVNA